MICRVSEIVAGFVRKTEISYPIAFRSPLHLLLRDRYSILWDRTHIRLFPIVDSIWFHINKCSALNHKRAALPHIAV